MKRKTLISLIVLIIMLSSSLSISLADRPDWCQDEVVLFPLSLERIEEGAFESTSVETLLFPNGFLSIGDNAFQDTEYLTDVYIPETVEIIGRSAFSDKMELTIRGIEGSYAEEWARKHKLLFIICDIWNTDIEIRQTEHSPQISFDWCVMAIHPEKTISTHERKDDEKESKRPQDRSELNPIDYRFP